MMESSEAALGATVLAGLRWVLKRRHGARLRHYRDRQGRLMPWLDLGSGSEGTVVWLHGFSDRPESFLRSAGRLGPNVRVIAPAMPGFHAGWRDPREAHSVSTYGDWLSDFLDEVVQVPYVLAGNSLGGAVALEIASRQPSRLRGLFLVNSAGMAVQGAPSVADEIQQGDSPFAMDERAQVNVLFSRLVGRPIRLPFPLEAALFEEFARDRDWYARLGKEISDSPPRITGDGWRAASPLSQVRVPTVIVWGTKDALLPRAHAERMNEALPDARIEWFEDVGHCPHLERPKQLAASLRPFVAAQLRPRGAPAR